MYIKKGAKEKFEAGNLEIVALYKPGITPKQLITLLSFPCSYARILKVLKQNDLPLRGRGGQNRKVFTNPFKDHTEESDYWLGFLIADGNVSKKRFSIAMQLKDVDHILKYRDFVCKDLTPYDRINEAGSLMRTILFRSEEVHSYLGSLGILPNKSKTIDFKYPLNGNILRGIFDGDGSMTQDRPRITTGSPFLRKNIEDFYIANNINFITGIKDKTKDHNTVDIFVRAESRQKLYDLMYKNATVFLERKYDKFRALVEKSTKKNIG